MRQLAFGFILEAGNEPLVRLDRETERDVVRLLAALLIALFEAEEEAANGEFDESA